MYLTTHLWSEVSPEKSGDGLMEVSLYVTSYFSLTTFRILSLSLIFAILITICFDVDLFEFILFGTSMLPKPGCLFLFLH